MNTYSNNSPPTVMGHLIGIEEVAADVRILQIKPESSLPFKAGQYINLSFNGEEPRAFSIASAPHEELLSFHIRNSGHGFSSHVFKDMEIGAEIKLDGSFGTGISPDKTRPLLLLAGGVGIAPMRSIIIDHLYHDENAQTSLYWSVRDKEHLYLDPLFKDLAKKHENFNYIPLISEKNTHSGIRSGFAGNAAAEDIEAFSKYSIYMAGPRAMIEATLPVLTQKNAEKSYIFHDAF